MKVFKYLKAIIILLLIGSFAFASLLTGDEILLKADEHRVVGDSFQMVIQVENYTDNQLEGVTVMEGQINNGEMTMVNFLEPVNMKGRKIIIEGEEMRLIIPNVKNPIRITASQKLVGGISYGDVAAMSYSSGYTAKMIGEETVAGMNPDGTSSDKSHCYVLELVTKGKKVNYHKIILWVEQETFLPVKGDFFALSGKKMTTVYYTAPREWRGKTIITKMFLFDQINTTKYFSMEYSNFKATQITDSTTDL